MTKNVGPIHPGEILREEFLLPMQLTPSRLAISIAVPASRIDRIVKGKRGITADTALRLSRFFGMTAEFWLNLQNHYDLELAKKDKGAEIDRIAPSAA